MLATVLSIFWSAERGSDKVQGSLDDSSQIEGCN